MIREAPFEKKDFIIPREVYSELANHCSKCKKCKRFELATTTISYKGLSHQNINGDLSESVFEESTDDTPTSNNFDPLPSDLEEYLESLDDSDISLSGN